MRFARVPDAREIARTFSIAGVISIVTSETSMLSAKTCTHPNLRLNVHTSPSRDRGSHILESALHSKVGHDLRAAVACAANLRSTCRSRANAAAARHTRSSSADNESGSAGASAFFAPPAFLEFAQPITLRREREHGESVTGTDSAAGDRGGSRAAHSPLSPPGSCPLTTDAGRRERGARAGGVWTRVVTSTAI